MGVFNVIFILILEKRASLLFGYIIFCFECIIGSFLKYMRKGVLCCWSCRSDILSLEFWVILILLLGSIICLYFGFILGIYNFYVKEFIKVLGEVFELYCSLMILSIE